MLVLANYNRILTHLQTDTAPPASSSSLESIREGKYRGLTGPSREGGGLGLKPPQEAIFSQPCLTVQCRQHLSQTSDTDIDQPRAGKPPSMYQQQVC